jgi:hypothetical protein
MYSSFLWIGAHSILQAVRSEYCLHWLCPTNRRAASQQRTMTVTLLGSECVIFICGETWNKSLQNYPRFKVSFPKCYFINHGREVECVAEFDTSIWDLFGCWNSKPSKKLAWSRQQAKLYTVRVIYFVCIFYKIMNSVIFWDIMPYSPLKVNWCFGGTYWIQSFTCWVSHAGF